jgi:hypothetical protein
MVPIDTNTFLYSGKMNKKNNFLSTHLIILFSLICFGAYSQLKGSYAIGGIGEKLEMLTLSYPFIFQSSECFVISSNISRFNNKNKGVFLIDCNSFDKDSTENKFYVIVDFYPNPAQNFITIQFDREIPDLKEFEIFYHTSAGSLVKRSYTTQKQLLNAFTDNISELNEGLYIVTLVSANFSISFKLIKNNGK